MQSPSVKNFGTYSDTQVIVQTLVVLITRWLC